MKKLMLAVCVVISAILLTSLGSCKSDNNVKQQIEAEPLEVSEYIHPPREDNYIRAVTVTGDYVNIRKEPSTDAEIVAVAHENDMLAYVDAIPDKGWYKIIYDANYCYVSMEFTALVKIPSEPTPTIKIIK